MPVIIGWFIGNMIGKLIAALITLLFRLLRLTVKLSVVLLRYFFIGAEWFLVKMWKGGRHLAEYYGSSLK